MAELPQFCVRTCRHCKETYWKRKWAYRRSISSRIRFASVRPWTDNRYFSTQETRWSLKVPLMSWWRMSGVIRWWMSARGKSFVKGYLLDVSSRNQLNNEKRTTISPTRPYSSQRTPNSSSLTSSSVWSRDRRPPPPSRSFWWAVHLITTRLAWGKALLYNKNLLWTPSLNNAS